MKQTEEKEKGGRKRTHLVKVYLSDDEYPDVLTVDTLSTILQVSSTTCYSLIKNKEIRSIRIGNQIRIPKIYLYEYLFRKEPMAV